MSELTGDEPDLELGSSGEGVVLMQVRLYALGIYRQVPDGTYDMFTESAVRELQSQLGQTNDGVVTRDTWEALLHQEQQAGIWYQYQSPYDALSQIRYDLEHAGDAVLSEDGQWQWDGAEWQPAAGGGAVGATGGAAQGYSGQLSDDGQWRWDGTDWQATGGAAQGSTAQGGQLSDDGQWRWDGTDWQPAGGAAGGLSDYTGMLSDDGQWRWNGSTWDAA